MARLFAGVLRPIALLPSFWHQRCGKVAVAWALAFLLPFAAVLAIGAVLASVMATTGALMLLILPGLLHHRRGQSTALMTTHAATLAAISAGAVFMGANTYVGKAPNLMARAIAESRGVRMPSFFGYMAWSGTIPIPLFIIATFVFFR